MNVSDHTPFNFSFYFEGQITTVCNMDYTKYPLDSQKCNIKFGSISQQNDVIVFEGQLTFNQNTQRTLQYSVKASIVLALNWNLRVN